ncbi:MAG: enoyl-CoA hydratase/isomerase family protein [Deltaproteobacteria bacterium]|nr:enoyl-CoA hydratase/isomerase family protein [Deltaproteobacteria bacterium]
MSEIKQFNGFKAEIGDISVITFNGAKVNVLSTAVLNDLISVLEILGSSPKKVKVLVVTGEGATFVAGADIKEMSAFGPEAALDFAKLIHKALDTLEGFSRPTIAAVNGFALGGGCELALSCDLAIASEAAQFGQPEINIGVLPGAGGTQRLPKRIGRLKAKELIFTGRRVGAEEALTLGLVNRIVPKDRLMEEVMGLAALIASKPAQCLEAAKSLIDSGSMEKEVEEFSKLFSYDDQKRLMREFLERKKG